MGERAYRLRKFPVARMAYETYGLKVAWPKPPLEMDQMLNNGAPPSGRNERRSGAPHS